MHELISYQVWNMDNIVFKKIFCILNSVGTNGPVFKIKLRINHKISACN